ncbi:CPBP family intramembrane glutamic endopeptidase [Oribacterium sp. P6A1]|uniref:CPBP family intramembrane glutamic endopeptidase n=1 Tax=Oribacterium sp. P6A1 TaxID=1410612 RepID=UPI00055D1E6F|nr:type II CAAX endopeptidase family protein [Oribacterium sp. P6A1]
MNNSIKHSFALIAMVTLSFEIIFQLGANLFILYGSDLYKNESFSMIVAGFLALLAGFLILGYYDANERKHYKKFSILKFLWLILLLRGLQFVTSILDYPVINWLYNLGFSLDSARADATGADITGTWDIIYALICAPVIEECFFRGILFNRLRKYGTIFAITITAFLFGLMHGNIFQLIVGFVMGILFAYVRAAYGLRFSILIHASNNLLALLMNDFTFLPLWKEVLLNFLFYGGVIAIIVTIVTNYKKLSAAIKKESSLPRMYMLWFTTIPVILVTLFYVLLTILSLFA